MGARTLCFCPPCTVHPALKNTKSALGTHAQTDEITVESAAPRLDNITRDAVTSSMVNYHSMLVFCWHTIYQGFLQPEDKCGMFVGRTTWDESAPLPVYARRNSANPARPESGVKLTAYYVDPVQRTLNIAKKQKKWHILLLIYVADASKNATTNRQYQAIEKNSMIRTHCARHTNQIAGQGND